ncbi:MAG: serine acetyltransferase [Spirochaetia bacterium]|nr:serine acetyltransferase [Spirochaetia bacterium]
MKKKDNKSLSNRIPADPENKIFLNGLVEKLTHENELLVHRSDWDPHYQLLPSRDSIFSIIEELKAALFPGYFGSSELPIQNLHFHVGAALDNLQRELSEQIRRGLCFTCHKEIDCEKCGSFAFSLAKKFLEALPVIQKQIAKDVMAAYNGDPAATSPGEAIFCYPGILAIASYRLANGLHKLGVPLLPRIITENAHSKTGIDIHPGAEIGDSFFIDHGTGVVIGETCIIGKNVRIYQGVTLGAKSFRLDDEGNPVKGIERHPIIEDNVIIYSGATILGRVVIGQNSIIGGNVWITTDVPSGSKITQAAAKETVFTGGAGI